ncbi:MAG: hypothetical protein WAN66_22830 [Limnoraphis robusta]|jgi:hypothetical protein|uniref:Uncharacterized protein n=2 Tax=Limnoraphis robusta TaxID=1118279 RepID=A0A0F5Y7F7_9CYAN|nr:hypothetical protein [Limnoraphis robusta]MCG5061722.1 hypothetical protein [Limnoraphis sp. WC205]KKD34562.1 hypothetical protein WN50_30205 [Limnoraphis robusta CS-951]MEA5495620.1 hypothetical protein [Limnoraphis robusta BA-68 BA1]MEA5520915.1 hypothetical protein [Limnoraphis robusta CCNP1315]MEA5538792.1 hypothetical protein [Limnoraphis robusta Tam1]
MTAKREDLYFNLIDELIRCPNGQEPEVLSSHEDLLDAGFIKSLMQVATMMAHENNQDGAKFLIHLARELSKALGLYPEVSNPSPTATES